jgi:hypothetical protein
MSPVLVLYAVILAAVVLGLWAAYKVLGTPSRLEPSDYTLVLEDLVQSVGRAAAQLRSALESPASASALEEAAVESRKIFQTGYYQTLRLRPTTGPDAGEESRSRLNLACEAYDWASRMVSSESRSNPAIQVAVRGLMDAGDRELAGARQAPEARAPTDGRSAPSP